MRTLIAIFILTLSVMAMAQTVTSGIVGNVRDSSGAAITNARVVVVNTATNARSSAQTGANGSYVLLQLNPGVYRLEVEANGFRQYVQTGIVLDIGQEARQDVALQVGQVSNTVTVQADATTLDTTTSTLGDVVNNKAILNLPLNTRNPFSLIALVPGYSGSIDNNYNGVAFSINGGRTDYGEIFVDGVPAGFPTVGGNAGVGVFPSVDAIGEFKVLAQNYPAEFGHSADGVVSVVYKSGTNQFHGTAFEFLRNSALDANNYFSDAQGLPLPSFKQSQFGGILTGPVRKDKTFFLLSTELLRQGSFASVTTTVPTLLQRQGDFAQTYAQNGKLITIYNPFSTRPNPSGPGFIRNPFPENKIPSTMLNPVALNVLKYFPLPNTTGNSVTNANNYYATGKTSNNINSWDIRIDHTLSSTQKISARYSDRFADSLPQPLFPAAQAVAEGQVETTDHMRNLDFAYTYIPSSKTILDARLGFARALYDYIPTNGSLGFLASSLGLPAALDTIDGVSMFPQFTQTGYATLGAASYDHNAFMTYSLLASLTKVYGSHTVKLGVDARMIRIDDHEADHPTGTYGFTTAYTQGPNPAAAGSNTGNGLASLLLGTGSGSAIQNYQNLATQSFYFAEYLQDDWMITPRLTLNAGIRYDLSTPRTERFNRMNYLDLNAPSPLAPEVGIPGLKGGLQFVGVDGHGRHQYD
ncbi:MAG TPA: carboxypeptidase-like regulatory domain-containing protein, partial [Edaphobacter sp.]|nr:carboxypeptidase-like regulatory domain-containing protein [Edaphobacter sp.]